MIDELDITEWTLSNGVRVVLKPTDLDDDEIGFEIAHYLIIAVRCVRVAAGCLGRGAGYRVV